MAQLGAEVTKDSSVRFQSVLVPLCTPVCFRSFGPLSTAPGGDGVTGSDSENNGHGFACAESGLEAWSKIRLSEGYHGGGARGEIGEALGAYPVPHYPRWQGNPRRELSPFSAVVYAANKHMPPMWERIQEHEGFTRREVIAAATLLQFGHHVMLLGETFEELVWSTLMQL
jgi:hypothetical protein